MADHELILSIELVDYTSSHASLYIEDIYAVVDDVLQLNPSEHIAVIQSGRIGNTVKKYNIGIKNRRIWYEQHLDLFLDTKHGLSTGKNVFIQRSYERYENVTVKNVPPHWGKEYVERVFSAYGTIINISQESLKYNVRAEDLRHDYSSIWNGNWRIRMKIRKAIPSNLIISDNPIEIHYRNQRKTCWRCGLDHQRRDCRTEADDFINTFDIEQFPELNPQSQQQEDESMEENVESVNEVNQGTTESGSNVTKEPEQQVTPDMDAIVQASQDTDNDLN